MIKNALFFVIIAMIGIVSFSTISRGGESDVPARVDGHVCPPAEDVTSNN